MPSSFLRCLARAVVKNAAKALMSCVPFGESLYEIAKDAIDDWRKEQRSAAERRKEIEQLANTSPEVMRREAAAVVGEVTASKDEKIVLASYLERLPGVVRRSLSRPE